MKHTNKPLAVLLSLLLAVSACLPLCAVAYAAPTVLGSGSCGKDRDNLTWTLTDDGVLTISGEGEMADYDKSIEDANFPPWKTFGVYSAIISELGYPDWASLKADLENGTADYAAYFAAAYNFNFGYFTKVIIEENVTSVGAYAFYEMNVPEVELPSTLRIIGDYAFASNSLTQIDLPPVLSELHTGAFADNDLTELVLPPCTMRARDFLDGNENFRKLTVVGRDTYLTYLHIPTVNVALPFTDYETFAAYRDLQDAIHLGKYVHDADYYIYMVLGALMHQYNWTAEQAYTMYSVSEAYKRQKEAEKLGVDLNDPDAIAAKINSILGTSLTEDEIFTTGPAFSLNPDLYTAVYPLGNPEENTTKWYDYALLNNYLGLMIIIRDYYNEILDQIDDPQDLSDFLSNEYAEMANFGVEASTPQEAIDGILEKVNSDLGLTGDDAYTEETAGTIREIRGGVSEAVKNAVIARFGTASITEDTEVRWYYGLTDHATGFQSDPEIKPAPWFTIKIDCDNCDVEMLESEDVDLELVHGDTVQTAASRPTATEHGYSDGTKCTVCGRWVTGHETLHNTVEVPGTEATATEHGYTDGTYCTVCETWVSGHETVHNTLGDMTVLRQPTLNEPGEAEIYCTVCGEKGLYAMEFRPPEQEEEQDPSGNSDNVVLSGLRKALASFVNFFLRLIKWLGRA